MSVRWSVAAILITSAPIPAAEPIGLRETFTIGGQYHVAIREEASGELRLPAEGDKPAPPPLKVRGHGAQEYDERILDAGTTDNPAPRTLRIYRRVELERTVDDQSQETTLRPAVRRLVILRNGHREVPFSPDGPLTWGEVHLISKDVFTPMLATALLPERSVSPGDRWQAKPGAAQELTDLEQIEGGLECRFVEITTLAGRWLARVNFAGTVRGVSEDGPSRQALDGFYYFDLESSHLSYLSLKGVHSLLDKTGQEAGRVEGQFTLTRQAHARSPELADDAVRGLALEPNADNTLLLYESAELGVRLLHPRRWRLQSGKGRQLFFDEPSGNGLMLTVEAPSGVPTAVGYLAETQAFITKEKGRVLRADAPRRLQGPPEELDQFGLDVEMKGRRERLEYFVVRQPAGGATVAARLLPGNDLAAVERDVERMVRSVRILPQSR
ncbi:MAG TPA: hypothetical protein VH120_18925 [Gemmataceae bacterium]|jgi:hypothetical protein|nr:hypothetical protein [Gemmataceae bacterium]